MLGDYILKVDLCICKNWHSNHKDDKSITFVAITLDLDHLIKQLRIDVFLLDRNVDIPT